MSSSPILRIAVPTPLRRQFDYLAPAHVSQAELQPGMRVKIPFGRQTLVGILLEVAEHSELSRNKLKPAHEILDSEPLFDQDLLNLLIWTSQYYQHPIGDVMHTALPVKLRQGKAAELKSMDFWQLSGTGKSLDPDTIRRAPKQVALMQLLKQHSEGISATQLSQQQPGWHATMKRLQEKNWVEVIKKNASPMASPVQTAPELNPDQQHAIDTVINNSNHYQSYLLEGVTGSGKTEVYLQVMQHVLAQNKQALVLVPEIGLTPQIVERVMSRLEGRVAVLHSALNDEERLQAWLACKLGQADIIIGTRSAVFVPLLRPGVIIVDEEHDLSFKQQDSIRYSARDLAVKRARDLSIPVILGSATPSLETLQNIQAGRYQQLHLPKRAGAATPPVINLIDVRSQKLEHGLSAQLITRMQQHLQQNNQVLLFLNRRGYAPVLMCHECGWHALCKRCDAHMTLHQSQSRLRCHHCGSDQPLPHACPSCNSKDLLQMGFGTERVEQTLQTLFPEEHIIRIDRDSTRRKGAMQALLEDVHNRKGNILIGTQMLAKGHHFPDVTLVGILNADHGFYSADFRAQERMGQLILQVAGRAGREKKAGEVVIQTHNPEHPLFKPLLAHDYSGFAATLLEERKQTELPPFTHLAVIRAEASNQQNAIGFLEQARKQIEATQQLQGALIMGPLPSPMEKRAGRFRSQLLIQSAHRSQLQHLINAALTQIENLKSARQVRWSLDIDPMDLF